MRNLDTLQNTGSNKNTGSKLTRRSFIGGTIAGIASEVNARVRTKRSPQNQTPSLELSPKEKDIMDFVDKQPMQSLTEGELEEPIMNVIHKHWSSLSETFHAAFIVRLLESLKSRGLIKEVGLIKNYHRVYSISSGKPIFSVVFDTPTKTGTGESSSFIDIEYTNQGDYTLSDKEVGMFEKSGFFYDRQSHTLQSESGSFEVMMEGDGQAHPDLIKNFLEKKTFSELSLTGVKHIQYVLIKDGIVMNLSYKNANLITQVLARSSGNGIKS